MHKLVSKAFVQFTLKFKIVNANSITLIFEAIFSKEAAANSFSLPRDFYLDSNGNKYWIER